MAIIIKAENQEELEHLTSVIAEYHLKLGARMALANKNDPKVSPSRELALAILESGYKRTGKKTIRNK